MRGKAILVTGASSGLGAHMAQMLAGQGARVAACARRIDALAALDPGPGQIVPIAMDVADPDQVTDGVARAARALGGLDALVNNAGIAWGGKALAMPSDDWDRVIEVNVSGVFRVAQACARVMAAGQGGAIVNIASILGLGTDRAAAAYAASKAAVVHLTRNLAVEWARHGIRVNALAPGYFPTDMTAEYLATEPGQAMLQSIPLRRFGQNRDLDGPLVLLLSDAGAYITGAVLPVDGGHLVRAL